MSAQGDEEQQSTAKSRREKRKEEERRLDALMENVEWAINLNVTPPLPANPDPATSSFASNPHVPTAVSQPEPVPETSKCMRPLQIGLLALEAIQACQEKRLEEAKSRIPALKHIPCVEDDLLPAYEAEVKRLTDTLDFTLGLLEKTRDSLQQTLTVLGFQPSEKILSSAKIGITLDRLGQRAYSPSLGRLLGDFFEDDNESTSSNTKRDPIRFGSPISAKRGRENSAHDPNVPKRKRTTSPNQVSA